MLTQTVLLALCSAVFGSPLGIDERQSCPPVHIFGARETTASPGYGSSSTVVNDVLNAHKGATAEYIDYPACGGQSSCGSVSYSSSVQQGTAAVVKQVSSFASKCPSTELVLVGYSQGAEIFDNALCGGGDPNQGLSSSGSIASYNIKAAIFMGDPRFEAGAPYNVGSCKAGGVCHRPDGALITKLRKLISHTQFDARPSGQFCGSYNTRIQSYCDATDPYCCNGSNPATHQGYGSEYGQAALNFVNSKL